MSAARRIKWLIRDAAFTGVYYSGIGAIYHRFAGLRRAVLSFHNILPEGMIGSDWPYALDLSEQVFRQQISYLARHWPVRPAVEVLDPSAEGVFLSFDDGMRNAYDIARPILAENGLTAMFAVCPGLIDGEVPHLWREHLYLILRGAIGGQLRLPLDQYAVPHRIEPANINRLGQALRAHVVEHRVQDVGSLVREICEYNDLDPSRQEYQSVRFHPLSWDRIRTMRDEGHVIASHCWSHRILSVLHTDEKYREIVRAQERLCDELGEPALALVYPYGGPDDVDAESMRIARDAGHHFGFMNVVRSCHGVGNMTLPRFGPPQTAYRPHLHAALTGLKEHMKRLG